MGKKAKKLIVATHNEGKVAEIRDILAGLPLEIVFLKEVEGAPVVIEDGKNLTDNALKKAHQISNFCGEITLADDSGLEVDALGGLPGVKSARFAGVDADDMQNNLLLLKEMKEVPQERRGARFTCVLAIVCPDGTVEIIEESCEGTIASAPRGKRGFGYDPLFIFEGGKLTFAEMGPQKKNMVSHRGKALRRLRPIVEKLFGQDRV
ncbi:MAG: XTP/dITP diphosphatase [Firmicutes bacterium]|nr:XTP/dITP diphosphatase [Bacillota bacterium]